jgi:hypothetical protein
MKKILIGTITTLVAALMLLSILPITASEGGSDERQTLETIYFDDFSTDKGWKHSGYWEIDSLGPPYCTGAWWNGPDPQQDHSPTSDNKVLGTRVPCIFYHSGTYWTYSPIIDCGDYKNVEVVYWKHDHTDYTPFNYYYFEVKDINNVWHRIWSGYSYPGAYHKVWTFAGPYSVAQYADENPNFQIRFGYYGWAMFTVGGANIDDLEVRGEPVGIPTEFSVEPKTLNLDSNGNYISIKVEYFPENPEYTPMDVNGDTMEIMGFGVETKYGTPNQNHFITKADRLLVEDAIGAPDQNAELEIKGKLFDGTGFKGIGVITAI